MSLHNCKSAVKRHVHNVLVIRIKIGKVMCCAGVWWVGMEFWKNYTSSLLRRVLRFCLLLYFQFFFLRHIRYLSFLSSTAGKLRKLQDVEIIFRCTDVWNLILPHKYCDQSLVENQNIYQNMYEQLHQSCSPFCARKQKLFQFAFNRALCLISLSPWIGSSSTDLAHSSRCVQLFSAYVQVLKYALLCYF